MPSQPELTRYEATKLAADPRRWTKLTSDHPADLPFGEQVLACYYDGEPVIGTLRPPSGELRRRFPGQGVVVVETGTGQQRIFRSEKLTRRRGPSSVFAVQVR